MRLKAWKMKPMARARTRARCAGAEGGHRLAREHVAPFAGRIEQAEDGQQRGLAAARRAAHRHVLPGADVEVDAGERVGLDRLGVEDPGDALEPDERIDGERHGSLRPQRDGGIHPGRPARGQQGGRERYQRKHPDARRRAWAGRWDSPGRADRRARGTGARAPPSPSSEAQAGERGGMAHHEPQHPPVAGAERHPDADLLRALGDAVGDDAVDADGREQQGDPAERGEQRGAEPGGGEATRCGGRPSWRSSRPAASGPRSTPPRASAPPAPQDPPGSARPASCCGRSSARRRAGAWRHREIELRRSLACRAPRARTSATTPTTVFQFGPPSGPGSQQATRLPSGSCPGPGLPGERLVDHHHQRRARPVLGR